MAESTRIFVGIDAHKDWIAAAAVDERSEDPLVVDSFGYDERRLRRFLKRLSSRGEVRSCYEASGGGYTLQRHIVSWGMHCDVIAPSLIPKRPGDRRKTDERDAIQLAKYYRGGLLTPVVVPTVERERVRGLIRCRDVLRRELHRSQQHVLKFTYARGCVFRGTKTNWTRAHWLWLRALDLAAQDRVVLDTHLALVDAKRQHINHLEELIAQAATTEPYREAVERLCCLRGVRTYGAMVLATSIGDVRRFPTAGHLMSYFGLIASEHSSGGPAGERRGAITKAGDHLCRHILVEAAHHYATRREGSREIARRRATQPQAVVAHARRADQRLWRRYGKLAPRLPYNRVMVAIARELTGFVWALMWDDSKRWLSAR